MSADQNPDDASPPSHPNPPNEPESSPSPPSPPSSRPSKARPLLDDLLWSIVVWMLIYALALAALLGLLVSARFGMGLATGTICAVVNLVAYTYVVNRLLDTGSPFWVTALVLKTFALFVVFGWLLKGEYVDAAPFVVGFAALPLGAVLGALLPLRRPSPDPPT